jgi:tripartite-type tricarboxylate transporter receptor subunit TctC
MIKQFLVSLAISLGVITGAQAFDPKAKPITVLIPFAPGGGADQTFRHFEKWASTKHGLTFTPVYKAGADGLIGMTELSRMPKDGYHIGFITGGTVAVQRMKSPEAVVQPLTATRGSIMALVTHADSGINSVADLAHSEKTRTLAYGAPGQLMFFEQLLTMNPKIKGKLIPYKGASPAVQDVIGKHVDAAAVPFIVVKQHVDAGTLRLLALGTREILQEYAKVPTIYSLFPKWQDQDGQVVGVPKGMDPAALKFWNTILSEYVNDKEIRAELVRTYNETVPFGPTYVEEIVSSAIKAMSK